MKRTACITGASSGIGEEFARQLAKKHYDLILVARSRDKLEALAAQVERDHGVSCEILPCDLSKIDECRWLLRLLNKRGLYLLVNCAGFGDIGYFHETSPEKNLEMVDVNVRALHLLTKGVLPDLVARDSGYILNVASLAGLMPGGPLMTTYYATKAYVVSLTNSISHELKMTGSKVRISALCPGPVDTNFNDVAGVSFALRGMQADRCVAYCLRQMDRGRCIIVPGALTRLAATAARIAPRSLVLSIVAGAQKRKLR